MPALAAHLILHLGLCGAIARTKPETSVAVRVRLIDLRGTARLDQAFSFDRGYDDTKVVEFDAPAGTWRMDVRTLKYGCSATDFQTVLPDHDRSIAETLSEEPAPPLVPVLLDGSAPQSFLYVQPTFVLLAKDTACNKPVGDLLPSHIEVENDQDAYYAQLYEEPPNNAPAVLALRLKTPTHQYHYVRLPIPYPVAQGNWPTNIRFDVTEDEIDGLASQPVDTLLCLHLWETKVYI